MEKEKLFGKEDIFDSTESLLEEVGDKDFPVISASGIPLFDSLQGSPAFNIQNSQINLNEDIKSYKISTGDSSVNTPLVGKSYLDSRTQLDSLASPGAKYFSNYVTTSQTPIAIGDLNSGTHSFIYNTSYPLLQMSTPLHPFTGMSVTATPCGDYSSPLQFMSHLGYDMHTIESTGAAKSLQLQKNGPEEVKGKTENLTKRVSETKKNFSEKAQKKLEDFSEEKNNGNKSKEVPSQVPTGPSKLQILFRNELSKRPNRVLGPHDIVRFSFNPYGSFGEIPYIIPSEDPYADEGKLYSSRVIGNSTVLNDIPVTIARCYRIKPSPEEQIYSNFEKDLSPTPQIERDSSAQQDDDEDSIVAAADALEAGASESEHCAEKSQPIYVAVRFKYLHGIFMIPEVLRPRKLAAVWDESDDSEDNDDESDDSQLNNAETDAPPRKVLKIGSMVLVHDKHGENVGIITTDLTSCFPGDSTPADAGVIISAANNRDRKAYYQTRRRECIVSPIAERIVEDLNLPIKICDSECQVDFKRLTIFYKYKNDADLNTAIDFRELQKQLYEHLHFSITLVEWEKELHELYPLGRVGPVNGVQHRDSRGYLIQPTITPASDELMQTRILKIFASRPKKKQKKQGNDYSNDRNNGNRRGWVNRRGGNRRPNRGNDRQVVYNQGSGGFYNAPIEQQYYNHQPMFLPPQQLYPFQQFYFYQPHQMTNEMQR